MLVGAGSIYRIIPCDEATALRAIRQNGNRPLLVVKLAEVAALAERAAIDPNADDDPFEDDAEERL